MHPFLEYLIKANSLLIFFWLFYRLFLHKETFYNLNRWYLLGSIALAIIAPFITFTKTVFIEAPKPTIDWDQLAAINSQNTIVEENLFTIESFVLVSIFIISTLLVLKTLFQLIQLYRNIHKLPFEPNLNVKVSNNDTVYSLYPYIVVPQHFKKLPYSKLILAHEQVHIQQKHSFDMLIIQLIRSAFWMNPLLRYFQKDIEVNLEYIVDEQLQSQFDSKTYQMSLLSFHTKSSQQFINTFNSQLKKRLIQINSKKSNPMKKLKMILVAPAIVAFFTMFQIETQAQIKEPLDIEKVNEEAQNLDSNKKNHTNNDLNSMPLNEDDLRYTTINIDDNGTNIQFPKNSKHLEDGTIVSEDGRILANIETKENSNNNLTFVINGEKVSHEEAKAFLEKNKDVKTTILNDIIVIESKEFQLNQNHKPLYIVNGKEITETDFRKIQPNDIESINVLKDKKAIDKYGEKGKNGVLEIKTKNVPLNQNTDELKARELAVKKRKEIIKRRKEERTIQRKEIEKRRQQLVEKRNETVEKMEQHRKELEKTRQERSQVLNKNIKQVTIQNKSKNSEQLKEDIEIVESLFKDLKGDVKNLEDENFKITSISASLERKDGTKIEINENY